jgi:hypothetical protein
MSFEKRMTIVGAALAAIVAAAPAAHAVEGCKAKVDVNTGAIQVFARKIGGTLRFDDSPVFPNSVFANVASCIKNGSARKCELGAAGTAAQITPPEQCKLFLRDTAGGSCSAYIKGCTPGVRPGGTQTVAGGAKAGVFAFCTATASSVQIRRSFNNVNGSAITIDDGALPGRCEITFPFSLADKYLSVEPTSVIVPTTTYKLDWEIDGSTLRIFIQQYLPPVWSGLGMDVSVLVF